MMKLNTSKWKEFIIGDIFPNIIKPPVLHSRQVIEKDDGIPYVVRTKFNNGIKYLVEKTADMLPSPAGVISFGAENATFFYQPKEFVSGRDIYYIDTQNLSAGTCKFLTACLQPIARKYSYNFGLFPDLLREEKIKLPSTLDGTPDWGFMDNFMSSIIEQTETSFESLRRVSIQKTKIDITNWRRFHLYDASLFDIDMGTKLDKAKMTEISPTVNFVGRANNNNGITTRVDKISNLEPYAAGNMTLSLGGEYLGSCFIQPDVFYTSQNVVVLVPKWDMPFEVKLFISVMVFRESRTYYKAFIDELNRHIKTDFSFYLPIDTEGNPDWDFMKRYMSDIMSSSEDYLKNLSLFRI